MKRPRFWRKISVSSQVEISQAFETVVFPAEIKEIQKRRNAVLALRGEPQTTDEVKVNNDLSGLSFSGGGVRSATFCLGIAQALVDSALFSSFDYLSTVSGGGYIGTTLTTSMAGEPESRGVRGDPPITRSSDDKSDQHAEPEIIRHLRNYSRYLAPVGKSRTLTLPALIALGFTINLLILLPGLIFLALGVRATSFLGHFQYPIIVTVATFSVWSALYAVVVSSGQGGQPERRQSLLTLTVWLAGSLTLFVFLNLQPTAVEFVQWVFDTDLRAAFSWLLGSIGAIGVLVGVAGYLFRRLGRYASRLWRLALGLLAPVALWTMVLAIVSTLYYPCAWYTFEATTGLSIVDTFRELGQQLNIFDLTYGPSNACLLTYETGRTTEAVQPSDLFIVVAFYMISAATLIITGLFVNVNATSLHAFYRDRLRDAYIIRKPGYEHPKLTDLPLHAPYQILNAAINIQSSSQNLRGRNAQPFMFSKLFCGSEITGWCRTEALQSADPQIDLAAAMAVSGAAIAPNQGIITNTPLRFLMAVANARLGYWLINPKRLIAGSIISQKVSPYFFLRELFGRLDETQKRIYVSDGGHIENLGVYELLRRKCRFIIIVDAEQDEAGTFHGLAHLMRIAKIDFNLDLKFSLADTRPNEAKISKAHAALGFVQYGPHEVGQLLYVKASLTGDEEEYIMEYKRRYPDFPHEPTTDQFFSEEQFEAYRALGEHIGEALVKRHAPFKDLSGWFLHLREVLVIDVVNRDAYLEVQKRTLRFEAKDRRDASTLDIRHTMQEIGQLIEFAVLKLDLNEKYIAVGPCRSIVARLAKLINNLEFIQAWDEGTILLGDDACRFISEVRRAPSDCNLHRA